MTQAKKSIATAEGHIQRSAIGLTRMPSLSDELSVCSLCCRPQEHNLSSRHSFLQYVCKDCMRQSDLNTDIYIDQIYDIKSSTGIRIPDCKSSWELVDKNNVNVKDEIVEDIIYHSLVSPQSSETKPPTRDFRSELDKTDAGLICCHNLPNSQDYSRWKENSGEMTEDTQLVESDMQINKYCKYHARERLRLLCLVCQQYVCSVCRNEVSAKQFNTALAIERKYTISPQMADMISDIKTQISDYKAYQNELYKQKEILSGKLKERRDYWHKFVDRWHEKLDLQIQTKCDEETERINRQIINLENDLVKVELHSSNPLANGLITDLEGNSLDEISNSGQDEMTEQGKYRLDGVLHFSLTKSSTVSYGDLGALSVTRVGCKDLSSINSTPKIISRGEFFHSFSTRSWTPSDYMATGLSLTRDGDIIVTDMGTDSVHIFSPLGRLKVTLSVLPDDQPSKAVAVKNQRIAVTCKDGIKLFSKRGDYMRTYRELIKTPQCIAVAKGDKLVISDTTAIKGKQLLRVFSLDFEHITTLTDGIDEIFTKPWYVATDKHGNILVSDLSDHMIKSYDLQGALLWTTGGQGSKAGQFFQPAGLCVDHYGHILVADSKNDRIQLLSGEGEYLAIILDEEDELSKPTDVAVDAKGELLVLQGNGEVKRFKYIT